MQKFFRSLFLRVALGFAIFFIAGLWFIATQMTPEAVYTTASGSVRHVFWSSVFLGRYFVAYLLLLPIVYLGVSIVRWLTDESSSDKS